MERREKKKNVLERSAAIFDLPGEALAGLPRIQLIGRGRLTVENHHGLLEYGNEEIHINGGKLVIRVKGQGLGIRGMNVRALLIEGRISSVELDG